jgi:hypothetical protein
VPRNAKKTLRAIGSLFGSRVVSVSKQARIWPSKEQNFKPFYTMFFNDIPEVGRLFDVSNMIKNGEAIDFNQVPTHC